MIAVALVAGVMAADLLTFAIAIGHVSIAAESNPIMALAYTRFGIVAVAILKSAATVVILALLARLRSRRARNIGVAMTVVIVSAGVASNVIAGMVL